MKVVVKDNDGKNVAYDLKGADAAKQLKDKPFLLKEGSQYKIQLSFKCQHEIITGLFPVLRLFPFSLLSLAFPFVFAYKY